MSLTDTLKKTQFSDRTTQEKSKTSEKDFLRMLGIPEESLITMNQIHSSQCIKILKSELRKAKGAHGDSMITSDPGIALGVRTADCYPLLMFDDEKKVISCIHAGWRGLSKRILDSCLDLMIKDFSCRPASILTAIGPGIEKCCYAVKEDVIEAFEASHISVHPFLERAEDRSFHLDLKGLIVEQLTTRGLLQSQIYPVPFCTFCSGLPLPSYRREGKVAGRALSVIMLTETKANLP